MAHSLPTWFDVLDVALKVHGTRAKKKQYSTGIREHRNDLPIPREVIRPRVSVRREWGLQWDGSKFPWCGVDGHAHMGNRTRASYVGSSGDADQGELVDDRTGSRYQALPPRNDIHRSNHRESRMLMG
jgi:hypothetical protein